MKQYIFPDAELNKIRHEVKYNDPLVVYRQYNNLCSTVPIDPQDYHNFWYNFSKQYTLMTK